MQSETNATFYTVLLQLRLIAAVSDADGGGCVAGLAQSESEGQFRGDTSKESNRVIDSIMRLGGDMSHSDLSLREENRRFLRDNEDLCTCVFGAIMRVMDKVRWTLLRAGSFLGVGCIAVSRGRAGRQIWGAVPVSGRGLNNMLQAALTAIQKLGFVSGKMSPTVSGRVIENTKALPESCFGRMLAAAPAAICGWGLLNGKMSLGLSLRRAE